MKHRLISTLIIVLFCSVALPQPPETIYQGTVISSGYRQNIPFASDGPFPIGFNFTFYGNTYTQFYVSANGLITFTDPTDYFDVPAPIPTPATVPNNFIAPFWDNLAIMDGGNILYTTVGASLTKKCIIQFTNMGFPAPMGTFSVILYESSNVIQIQYRLIVDPYTSRAHGGNASIGLENANGTLGTRYAYLNGNAVHTGDAISFTPSGSDSYTVDPDVLYDGVFLTINAALPDPGIVQLINPSENAIVGVNQTFEWSPASNTSTYYLIIDDSPDLATPFLFHDAGLNLSYDVTGLTTDKLYYWAVFSSNTTGITWGEESRFSTSTSPPLTAVPREFWTAQGDEREIKLQYSGGDASTKTAIVTYLPVKGQLFQVSGGVKGTQITSVNTIVTDPQYSLIYVANGGTGNDAGNFNFKFHDNTGDSPEATITINVSPPGIPNLLYVARDQNIELQFDRIMNDPAGKQDQFTVKVDGSPVVINSASLKNGDPYTIILTLQDPLGAETVYVSYAQGNVSAATGGLLASFIDLEVTLHSQTINFPTLLNRKYGDPPFVLTAGASSGLETTFSSSNFSVASILNTTLTIHSTGTSDITARQAGNTTYAPARFVKPLTVAKGDQVITFAAPDEKIYGDPDFTISGSVNSGLPVSFSSGNTSVATLNGNIVHITGAGTSAITASQAGNDYWNPAQDVIQTLTVNKAGQTITFDPLPLKTYGDPDFTLSATASSGFDVHFASDNSSVATVTGNVVHINGAGTAVITASQAGNENWNPAPDVPQTLTVSKADQLITFNSLPDRTYGDGDFNIIATSSSGLNVTLAGNNDLVATLSGSVLHITGAGTITITASQPGNSNYNPAPDVPQQLTVNKAGLVFTANNKTKEYLAAVPPLTYTVTGFVYGENETVIDVPPSVQTTAVQNSPAGEYPVTISGGNDNCYSFSYVAGTLTINKALQTITFTSAPDEVLEGDTYTLAASSSSQIEVSFESLDNSVAAVTGNILTGVSKGTVQIRAFNTGSQNYHPAEAFITVRIVNTHADIMNLFTPNNDGYNDYWELPEMAAWGKCNVKIYNRWGKLVFSNPAYDNLWDGTSNGNPLPEGAYVYIISTENEGVIKGTLNIVR